MANYIGDGRFVSLLSGVETRVTVRKKTVDATYYGTSVPSTHTPGYKVGSGVNLVSPNALPHMALSKAPPPACFVIVGAGKTAMDVGVWLLQSGALLGHQSTSHAARFGVFCGKHRRTSDANGGACQGNVHRRLVFAA